MAYFNIGASAANGAVPCHSEEAWDSLLDAMVRGDPDEIIRITTSARPTMIAAASLRRVERPSMADTADQFWQKRGQTPKPRATDASGALIVLAVRT